MTLFGDAFKTGMALNLAKKQRKALERTAKAQEREAAARERIALAQEKQAKEIEKTEALKRELLLKEFEAKQR